MKDLYEILGVAKNAKSEDIKKAYLDKAKKYHPDLNSGNKDQEELFKEISNAYDILKDDQKRMAYDQNGHKSSSYDFDTSGFSYTSTGFANNDINNILNEIFNRQGHQRQQVYQNQNINLNYQITLEDAFTGKEAELSFSYKMKDRSITVNIPPGIENGMKIRYTRMGDDSLAGIPPGDLLVTIGIIPHSTFIRIDKKTLLIRQNIDYLDAILGTEIDMPTIDGSLIKLTIPPNTTNGLVLKVTGKGMKEAVGNRGDMLVELLLIPPNLTIEQRKMIEKIRS